MLKNNVQSRESGTNDLFQEKNMVSNNLKIMSLRSVKTQRYMTAIKIALIPLLLNASAVAQTVSGDLLGSWKAYKKKTMLELRQNKSDFASKMLVCYEKGSCGTTAYSFDTTTFTTKTSYDNNQYTTSYTLCYILEQVEEKRFVLYQWETNSGRCNSPKLDKLNSTEVVMFNNQFAFLWQDDVAEWFVKE